MSPTKRGPYRKHDSVQKRLRIKEYVPPNLRNTILGKNEEKGGTENAQEEHNARENEDENPNKKRHGSWSDEKELALMRAYVSVFPPAWKRGTVSDGWRQVIDQVNAVAPNDTPLEYDACRRNVDRIISNYKTAGGYKYQKEMEEAVSSALHKKEAHEEMKGKKSKKPEIEAQNSQINANEAPEIPSSVTLQTQQKDQLQPENNQEEFEVNHRDIRDIGVENHSQGEPSGSLGLTLHKVSTVPAPSPTRETQPLEEQRQFQQSVLSALESIAQSTRNTEKLFEKMLLHLQNKTMTL